ncbi:glycosyl transferase family 2 [Kineothrix alysoides]|uniref:Glycosyl transferase family 2 n=1 Tax=Kineothrix alysoides TaxID=1469948 RepID=A0A4R1QYU3_9FIRM|nr:glycosyltransferase [Kineothrix alysoides]TCL58130.1 glycosyl transferase family 2 [Kineothrix alysoides]
MTIIIVAHNQIDKLKINLKTIYLLESMENLSVIVIDDASSDGMGEWVEGQQDISYAFMEEFTGYAAIINEAVEALVLMKN